MAETKRRRQLDRGSLGELIIDHLTTHGGWHTTAALRTLSDSTVAQWNQHPVNRALHRLRNQGLIEGRPVELNTGKGAPQNEWRATDRAWEYP